jgi:protein-S-isoprenylcysteine O-methyltransferase Ste14
MNISAQAVQTIVFILLMAGWFSFAAIFIFRTKPPAEKTRRRERASIFGIVLQALSYFVVWVAWRRPGVLFIERGGLPLVIALSLLTLLLELYSLWLVRGAVRALGKQWSLTARVTEGHRLVIEGPYRIVRNPIYTGMLGMLLATGFAFSRWPALVVGVVVFITGTMIRVRSEEKLLRETFGEEFEAYAKRVPALIPGLY